MCSTRKSCGELSLNTATLPHKESSFSFCTSCVSPNLGSQGRRAATTGSNGSSLQREAINGRERRLGDRCRAPRSLLTAVAMGLHSSVSDHLLVSSVVNIAGTPHRAKG